MQLHPSAHFRTFVDDDEKTIIINKVLFILYSYYKYVVRGARARKILLLFLHVLRGRVQKKKSNRFVSRADMCAGRMTGSTYLLPRAGTSWLARAPYYPFL